MERQIQKQVFAELRKRARPGVFYFHVPNNPRGRKASGFVAGVPDLLLIKGGSVFALELKAEKGTPSPKQFEAVDNIRNAGGFAAITYGLDRAIRCLETWNLLRPPA